jgi:hypothetical protein
MSASNSQHTKQRPELLAQIRDLARRYRSLVSKISSAELLADRLSLELAQIEKALETGSPVQLCADEKSSGREDNGRVKEQLRRLADSGAALLEIKARSDGLCDVRIDAGKQFKLPPVLADLLAILSLDGGRSDDGLVRWKTLDEVAILLGKRWDKRFSRHTVTQSVYRLRRELFKRGGTNPYLVQTNRRRGARFALKRKIVPVIESN